MGSDSFIEFNDPQAQFDSRTKANANASRLGDNPSYARLSRFTSETTLTCDQGASTDIAHTKHNSDWRYDGPYVEWDLFWTFTAAGSAGNPIAIDLPVPAVASWVTNAMGCGHGRYYHATTGVPYNVEFIVIASTVMYMYGDQPGGPGPIGSNPSIAVANTSDVRGQIKYRWI